MRILIIAALLLIAAQAKCQIYYTGNWDTVSFKSIRIGAMHIELPNDTVKCVILHFDFDGFRYPPGAGIKTRVDSALLITDKSKYPIITSRAIEIKSGRQIDWSKILIIKKHPQDFITL